MFSHHHMTRAWNQITQIQERKEGDRRTFRDSSVLDLTNDEVEYLKLFEEEIEVRLKYRNQMRRWEMGCLLDDDFREIKAPYPLSLPLNPNRWYTQKQGCDDVCVIFLHMAECMTRSSTRELLSPFENPEQKFRSKRRLFDTPSLVESNSPEFDHNFDILEQSEEEVRETMTETMEQYMSKTRENYGSGVTRPTINQDTPFELKGQFLKELRDNTFSGSEHEDANEHIEKVLEIVDLFHIPKVTQDQIMLRAFPVSLTGAASRWLRNQPSGSITTWEVLKTKFLNKYCPPARTAKKMEEINNFQQEPDESLFRAWERFKELLMKCPQHYLTDMQEGVIPSKTAADAKIAIQEMAEYSQKWHNGTSSRTKSTETYDGLAAI
ncbi:retrovirus-related pol polyprotein from transposon TNT 1-94 [Tanacetum coccineum]